jgi:uncharacterized protein
MEYDAIAANEKRSSPPQTTRPVPSEGPISRRFYERLTRLLIRRPLAVSLLLAAATAVAAFLATGIRYDFSTTSVYAGNDRLVQDAARVSRTFGDDDKVLLVLLESTGRRDVLDKDALTWQAELDKRLSQLGHVSEVRSLPGMRREELRFGLLPQRVRVPLVAKTPVDETTETDVRGYFAHNKLAEQALLSSDRSVAAIAVNYAAPDGDLNFWQSQVAALKEVLAADPPPPGYRVHVSGRAAMRVDIVQNLHADQEFLIPIAAMIYLVVLALIFRRLSASVLLLGLIGIGICWGMAVMAVGGYSLNLISNVLPMLLMVLGVSNGVHLLSRYGEEYARVKDRREAAVRTMRHCGGACFLAFLTTAIGFASLWAARADVMNAFATQALIGLGCLFASLVVVLGTYLPFFRPPKQSLELGSLRTHRRWLANRGVGVHASACLPGTGLAEQDTLKRELQRGRLPGRLLFGVTDVVVRHPALTMLVSLALVAGSLWTARGIHVNSYTVETYDENHPTLQTMRLVENKLGGLLSLNVMLKADEPGRFLRPETVRRVARIEKFAQRQKEILSSRSYIDLHRAIDERISGDTEGAWPPLGEEGRDRLRRNERFLRRFADEAGYGTFITPDASQVQLQFRVRDVGTRKTLELAKRLRTEIAAVFPASAGVSTTFSGDAFVNARAIDAMIRDLFATLAIAAGVIFAVMALLFRSPRLGLIAAIPNLTPLALTLGYMGLRGLDMNAANVIVFTISVGIAVDDTIHFLYRYREEQAKFPRDRVRAVRATLRGTGRPIVLTSFLIICGLAVLYFSTFVPTRRFAELTMVTIGGALLGDLLLLPAGLLLFGKKPAEPAAVLHRDDPRHPEDGVVKPSRVLEPVGDPAGR